MPEYSISGASPQPTKLQEARARRGWSQTQVISRLRRAASTADIAIPDDACLKTQLSRWERGTVRRITTEYRRLLRTVYELSDSELGLLPAEPPILQQFTNPVTPKTHPGLTQYYESLFVEHVKADNFLGPHPVLDIVSHQAMTLSSAVRHARGKERSPLVRMACRYEEFLGWLNQDSGNATQAMIHTDRARDLSTEIDDPQLSVYLLMRKSNIATDSSDPALALALADAALRQSAGMPVSIQAVVLRQKAHALAGLNDGKACAAVIGEALEVISEKDRESQADSIAFYCTPDYVAMEAATCWLQLNQPDKALIAFAHAPIDWPPQFRRDHGLHLTRRAMAHAGVGDISTACALATQAIDTASQTASARNLHELQRLSGLLGHWDEDPLVGEVLSSIAKLVVRS